MRKKLRKGLRFFKAAFLAVAALALVLPLVACEKRNAEENYRVAEELLKSGHYKDAAGKYASVISIDEPIPEVVDSYYKLGIIYSQYLDDPNSSVYYLEEMVKKFPSSQKIPIARKEIALAALYKLNRPEKAVEQLNFIEKGASPVIPQDEVSYLKGKAFTMWKQNDHALAVFDAYSGKFSTSKHLEEVSYLRCIILFEMNRQAEAISSLKRFIERYPSGQYSDMARYDLGVAYESLTDLENAILAYRSVGASYPAQDALKSKIAAVDEIIAKKSKSASVRTAARKPIAAKNKVK